jgi:hypothetical protein
MANPTKHPHGGPPDQHGEHGKHDRGEHQHPGDNPQVSYERKDINIVQITGFGIGLLVACMVTVFAMWVLFEYFAQREDKVNPAVPHMMESEKQQLPPEPRLEPEPGSAPPIEQLKQLRDNEEMLLTSYGWVDQAKGTVHIPIDQAIDMVAQKGLPVKVSPAGGDNAGYRMIPSDASGGRTLEKISQ